MTREHTPEQQALIDAHPWICPTKDMTSSPFDCIEGVTKVPHAHVAVRKGAIAKIMFLIPIHSADLERVDDYDWELFTVNYVGMVKDQVYVWGSFAEGIGMFHVMVPAEHIRKLTVKEREIWSKKRLGMYGSHSGNLSDVYESGVEKEA